MLPLISILAGATFLAIFSLMLWFMFRRPPEWMRFIEKDHDFWVKRGFPVKWAGACKRIEQGRGFKILVMFCILVAVMLIVSATVLLPIAHHH